MTVIAQQVTGGRGMKWTRPRGPKQLCLFTEHVAAPCRHCGWPARTAVKDPVKQATILEYCTECGWVEFTPPRPILVKRKTA